jgi:hypothetical protein
VEFTTSIINIQTTHCNIPEDNYHHTHHPENLQSYQTVFIFRNETTLKQILIIAALFRMLGSVMPSEWQTNQQFKDHSLLNDHHVKRSIHKPKCHFSKKAGNTMHVRSLHHVCLRHVNKESVRRTAIDNKSMTIYKMRPDVPSRFNKTWLCSSQVTTVTTFPARGVRKRRHHSTVWACVYLVLGFYEQNLEQKSYRRNLFHDLSSKQVPTNAGIIVIIVIISLFIWNLPVITLKSSVT